MHVHFCKIPIENNVKNKEVKTAMMQDLKAKNLCSIKKWQSIKRHVQKNKDHIITRQ